MICYTKTKILELCESGLSGFNLAEISPDNRKLLCRWYWRVFILALYDTPYVSKYHLHCSSQPMHKTFHRQYHKVGCKLDVPYFINILFFYVILVNRLLWHLRSRTPPRTRFFVTLARPSLYSHQTRWLQDSAGKPRLFLVTGLENGCKPKGPFQNKYWNSFTTNTNKVHSWNLLMENIRLPNFLFSIEIIQNIKIQPVYIKDKIIDFSIFLNSTYFSWYKYSPPNSLCK